MILFHGLVCLVCRSLAWVLESGDGEIGEFYCTGTGDNRGEMEFASLGMELFCGVGEGVVMVGMLVGLAEKEKMFRNADIFICWRNQQKAINLVQALSYKLLFLSMHQRILCSSIRLCTVWHYSSVR